MSPLSGGLSAPTVIEDAHNVEDVTLSPGAKEFAPIQAVLTPIEEPSSANTIPHRIGFLNILKSEQFSLYDFKPVEEKAPSPNRIPQRIGFLNTLKSEHLS